MITSTTKTIAAAFAVAAALGATTAQAASSKSPAMRVAGTCSDTSTSKLKVKRDHGRLQVEFEVDQNRNDVPWAVELRKDGRVVFQGTRLTQAPSGSFSLERRIAGTGGDVKALATRNGETCSATLASAKLAAPAAAVSSSGPAASNAVATPAVSDDGPAHDVNDDHGHHGNDD